MRPLGEVATIAIHPVKVFHVWTDNERVTFHDLGDGRIVLAPNETEAA